MTELRICFIGDSLTHGTRDDTTLGWPGRLCTKALSRGHDVTLYNLGIRRDTSADIATRWQAEVNARLPATAPGALVFSFGVNDMACDEQTLFRVPPAESHKLAREIISAASARWPVLWLSPAPIGRKHNVACALWSLEEDYQDKRAAQLTQDYAHIARDLNVPFLDIFTPLARSRMWRWALARGGDGTHPSARGYAMIARLVERWPAWQAWFK
jgi:lysophospholipase L1-like esterase